MLEIDKSRTTPYHPQSDGLVERMNRTLEAMLSMFTSNSQRDWDEYLPYVMMAYRSAIQDTTGYSPSQMMLGREVELPIDIIMGHPEEDVMEGHCNEYVDQMKQKMTLVHDRARNNIQIRSDRQKRNYDLRAHPKRYEPGDAVWIHNPARKKGISPKLSRPWDGPYLVVDRISDVTYRIQKGPKTKPKVVHFDRLKLYQGDNFPTWHIRKEDKLNVPDNENEVNIEDQRNLNNDDNIINEVFSDHEENNEDDNDNTIIYEPPMDDNDNTIIYEPPMEKVNANDETILYEYMNDEVADKRKSRRTINKPMRYRDE